MTDEVSCSCRSLVQRVPGVLVSLLVSATRTVLWTLTRPGPKPLAAGSACTAQRSKGGGASILFGWLRSARRRVSPADYIALKHTDTAIGVSVRAWPLEAPPASSHQRRKRIRGSGD